MTSADVLHLYDDSTKMLAFFQRATKVLFLHRLLRFSYIVCHIGHVSTIPCFGRFTKDGGPKSKLLLWQESFWEKVLYRF